MTDKVQKIREEVEKRYGYWKEKEFNSHSIESEIRMSECKHLLLMLDSLQEEPKIPQVFDEGYWERLGEEPVSKEIDDYNHKAVMESLHPELKEESVSEDLEKMSYHSAMDLINNPKFLPTTTFGELIPMIQKLYKDGAKWQKEKEYTCYEEAFEDGAKWKVENIWKPADGNDLPEIDMEVIALLDNGKVGFAHRPDPKGWDGKSITTGEVEHYTPKTYGKGGWNIPDVKWWLDCSLPNMEED